MEEDRVTLENLLQRIIRVEDKLDLHMTLVSETRNTVEELRDINRQQKGFLAGMFFIISILITGITLLKTWLVKTFLGM